MSRLQISLAGRCVVGFLVCAGVGFAGMPVGAGEPPAWLREIPRSSAELHRVGPEGHRNAYARSATRRLIGVTPVSRVTDLLQEVNKAERDGNPLAANYFRAVVDAVCERELTVDSEYVLDDLQVFALDRTNAPRARRLAYEWLVHYRPEAVQLTHDPAMLDDPSVEMRRDAIAYQLTQVEKAFAERNDDAEHLAGLKHLLTKARDRDQIEDLIRKVRAAGEEVDEAAVFGYLTEWQVVGPFDNTEEQGLGVVYPPEKGIDLNATYAGKHGDVQWVKHMVADPRGKLDLNAVLEKEKSVCAYALATVDVPAARPAQLRLETFNALRIWVNGEKVATYASYHAGAAFDQYIVPIELKQGENTILIKVCQNDQPQSWAEVWDLKVRLTDETGGAILK